MTGPGGLSSRRALFIGQTRDTYRWGNFGSFDIDVRQRIHEVKFGINYLFNWGKGAPVVARY